MTSKGWRCGARPSWFTPAGTRTGAPTSIFDGHPFLTDDAAQLLVKAGALLVGIGSPNIDDTGDRSRPVHSTLLASDISIVEHLCGLGQPADHGFRLFAAPVKVKGFGTLPVRAFAVVP